MFTKLRYKLRWYVRRIDYNNDGIILAFGTDTYLVHTKGVSWYFCTGTKY